LPNFVFSLQRKMAYRNLLHFIECLEKNGELSRITEPVSPHLEIAEITDRITKSQGKALLFENTGKEFPLLINAFGSEKRMCLALGISSFDIINQRIDDIFTKLTATRNTIFDKLKIIPLLQQFSQWMPKMHKGRGACQEVVMETPDLNRLPVLTCWKHDGGPFITLPVVHTLDPENGSRNVGMYRMQVFSDNTTGMHWHLHKNSAMHFHKYKKSGKRMPITVTLGGDPIYTYAATAPLPESIDEYLFAGFLRQKPIEMVKSLTNDIYIPSDVDFVIEGYADPYEELVLEGPFGDHTGFYSLPDFYPRFHVTCITHRKNAVYPATIVGIPPQEDAWLGMATEKIFLKLIQYAMLPEVVDMHMPFEGVFHNLVLLKISKAFAGHALKVMNALWGAGQMMFNKIMIVVDEQVDIHNYFRVLETVAKNTDPQTDLFFSKGPSDVLDHASRKFALGGKIGIDATRKFAGENGETLTESEVPININAFLEFLPPLTKINTDYVADGHLLITSLNKIYSSQIHTTINFLYQKNLLQGIRYWVLIDEVLFNNEISDIVWQVGNNIDPSFDCKIIHNILVIDGTKKTKSSNNMTRPWPNIIVADNETIQMVDNKWQSLGLGKFIPSPSLRYMHLIVGYGAVAEEN